MLSRKILNIQSSKFIPRAKAFSFSSQTSEIEYKNAKPFSEIPGIKSPLTAVKFLIPGGRYYNLQLKELMEKMQQDYGNLVMFNAQFGKNPMVATFSPDDYELIFRLEGKWPHRRELQSFEYFRKKVRPDLFPFSAGLTVEQGAAWGDFRTKVNQIMMQPRNTKKYIPGIDEVAIDFIASIRKVRNEKLEMPENFSEMIKEWAMESIALIALDTRLGILTEGNDSTEDGKRLNHIIKEIFEYSYKYDILPSIWRVFKTPGFKKAMKTYEEAAEIAMRHVLKGVEKYEKNPTLSDHEGVLEKLLKIDKSVALVMAVDMLGGGVDTTASAVSYILYNLAKNPDKQEKLRKEVLEILPSKDSKLNSDSLSQIPYMRAVIKESLRLYPVTIGNLRSLSQDIVLQGYQIPKGTDIFMNHVGDKQFYEEPSKFIPERWLKDNDDPKCPHAKNAHPFSFLPFGFGSRMCIGKRFADLEMEVITARIIREFTISWEQPDLKIKSIILNFPASPLKFKMVDY